jgi:hypothetical protein
MQQRIPVPGRKSLRAVAAALMVLALLFAEIALPFQASAQADPDDSAPPVQVIEAGGDAAAAGVTVQINANRDTFIASNQPNTNFGGLSNLDTGWYASFGAVRPLIRFSVGSIPQNARVYSAQLFLYLDFALPNNDSNMTLNYAPITQSWSEGDATWNNAAGIGGSQSRLGSVGVNPGWASFDLTGQVQQWVNGSSNNGIIIIGDETPSLSRARIFRSREYGGFSPYLLVNYECDTLAPSTTMNGLPQYSPGVFTASWAGQDLAPSGCKPSGIRKHVVQYRVNGGPWVDWKSTTSSSATFNDFAPNGAVVDFRTWADDNAGNVERTPSNPQTFTIIVSQAPVVNFAPLPVYTYASNFTITWSASASPVPVTGYDVQYQLNGGQWIDLLSNTTQTSFQFANAQNDGVYGFRARARDAAGNVGVFPANPQVQTTVVLFPTARMVQFNPNIINSSSPVTTTFTLNWVGATPPGTTIVSYQIYSRVFDFNGVQLQPWKLYETVLGSSTSTVYTPTLGNAFYEFEATATNNQGQTTPVTQQPEAIMVVDLDDTFSLQSILPYITGN